MKRGWNFWGNITVSKSRTQAPKRDMLFILGNPRIIDDVASMGQKDMYTTIKAG